MAVQKQIYARLVPFADYREARPVDFFDGCANRPVSPDIFLDIFCCCTGRITASESRILPSRMPLSRHSYGHFVFGPSLAHRYLASWTGTQLSIDLRKFSSARSLVNAVTTKPAWHRRFWLSVSSLFAFGSRGDTHLLRLSALVSFARRACRRHGACQRSAAGQYRLFTVRMDKG